MAKIANPRKVFNFRIEILGFDQFEAQKVDLPEWEIDQTEHGDTNHKIKTGGMVKFGNIKMEKVRPLPIPDNFFIRWMESVQSAILGGGALPINYKQIIVVKEMDTTGLIPMTQHVCEGVWPCKSSWNSLDRMSSDNVIQTIELSVDRITML